MRGWKVFAALAALVIVVELGGIWRELHGIRAEQVKSAAAVMDPEQAKIYKESEGGRHALRSMSGELSLTGSDENPLPVAIRKSEDDPVHVQAQFPLPVEVQR